MIALNPRTAIPIPAGADPVTVVLGVDIGTTAVKVAAFDPPGRELASAVAGYRLYESQPGFVEQDPHEIVDATLLAIRRTAAAVGEHGAPICGLCVSAAMHITSPTALPGCRGPR
jgi:sugar (pentulose or hexulose) kinase